MEKISGILPKSPRLSSVDIESSPPARPGSPANGRVMGVNDLRDRVTRSSLAKIDDPTELAGYKNMKEAKQAKIVEELNRKFFATQPSRLEESAESMEVPMVVSVTVHPKPDVPEKGTDQIS